MPGEQREAQAGGVTGRNVTSVRGLNPSEQGADGSPSVGDLGARPAFSTEPDLSSSCVHVRARTGGSHS